MLEKNDKIRWHLSNFPATNAIVYTILDIDRNRPGKLINPADPEHSFYIKEQILMEWEQDGQILRTWAYDYDEIIKLIEKGKIIIVQKHNIGTPIKNIKKLKF